MDRLRRRCRLWLGLFVIGLLVSGVTAFPLEWEVSILNRLINGPGSPVPGMWPAMAGWVAEVHTGLSETCTRYPFMAYGTDWLAFAHVAIAISFWGPLKDPVRNIWVIEFGMIACVLVIPLALICGAVRGIPFFHQVVDCSFGVVGIVPLWISRSITKQMERLGASSMVGIAKSGG